MEPELYTIEVRVEGRDPFEMEIELVPGTEDTGLLSWFDNMIGRATLCVAFFIDERALNGTRVKARFPLVVRRDSVISAQVLFRGTRFDD